MCFWYCCSNDGHFNGKKNSFFRDTPTAAGPNSFGKGRLGFCDRQRMIQKEIEKEIQRLQDS